VALKAVGKSVLLSLAQSKSPDLGTPGLGSPYC